MNAVIYCRKSTEDERTAEDGKSTARQEERARAFAQEQGWRVLEVFKDEDVSGAEFVNRPGFAKLLTSAKQKSRPFDVVIVMALNRLGRDQARVMMALTDLHDAKVRVFAYQTRQEVKMGSPTEILIASVEAFADAAYRHSISLSTSEALHEKAKRGHAVSSPPFGYRVIRIGSEGKDGHSEYEVVEDERPRVIKVFELAIEFGNGKVAKKLNAKKVPGPDGRPWSKEHVRRVVANRLCKGELVYGRYRSVVSGGSAAAREPVPEAQWIVKSVPHLRIVSDALWNRVRAARAKTTMKYGVPKVFAKGTDGERKHIGAVPVNLGFGSEHMLNQIARCGVCQGTLSLQPTKNGTGHYRCNKHKRGLGCTNSRGVPADLLEDFVRVGLHERLNDEKYIFELLDLVNRRAEKYNREHALTAGERASLEREVKKLQAAVEKLTDGVEAGQPVGDRLKQRTAELAEKRARLDATPVPKVKKATFFELLEAKAIGLISLGGADQVRDALRTVGVERIVVTPLPKGGWSVDGIGDPGRIIPPPISGGSDALFPPESTPPVEAPHSIKSYMPRTESSSPARGSR